MRNWQRKEIKYNQCKIRSYLKTIFADLCKVFTWTVTHGATLSCFLIEFYVKKKCCEFFLNTYIHENSFL